MKMYGRTSENWDFPGRGKIRDGLVQCVKHGMRKHDMAEQMQVNARIDKHLGVRSILGKHLTMIV